MALLDSDRVEARQVGSDLPLHFCSYLSHVLAPLLLRCLCECYYASGSQNC